MSTEVPTSPQAPKSADDCIAKIAELAELAANVLVDAQRLRDRVAELEKTEYLPALIATFRSLDDDEITGIHRTALKPDGHKIGKRMLGIVHRAAVRDALAGVIYPITDMYDVPLMVARGYATLSFLYSAAEYIDDLDVPTYIYHLGDFDPSGVNVGEKIEETLRELAPDAKIYFERIAGTPGQITEWNLPTPPTKASDTRSKGFGNISVDLDAINPNALRALVQETIEQHLPPDQFAVLKAAEQSEREVITAWWAGSHRDPRHRKLNLGGQHGRRTSEEARSQSRYQREGRRGNNSDR